MAAWGLALYILSGLLSIIGLVGYHQRARWQLTQRPWLQCISLAQSSTLIMCWLLLIGCYINNDLAIKNVAENTLSTTPLMYKIAGAWSNHQGSFLLWVMVMTSWQTLFAWGSKQFQRPFHENILCHHQYLVGGFILYGLWHANPFMHLAYPVTEGLGMNPLLEDPMLIIHPPFLYAGAIGLSIPLAMIWGIYQQRVALEVWLTPLKHWLKVTWLLLTIGITLGSLWAYYELGWGGWWFWDPVENLSLLPWLAATASIHLLLRPRQQTVLTLGLGQLSFVLVVIGHVLIRSGIITSVHAFAQPEGGSTVLLLSASLLSIVSLIKAWQTRKYWPSSPATSSPTALLTWHAVLMICVLLIMLIAILTPIVLQHFSPYPLSIGTLFYTTCVVPLLIITIFMAGVGPIMHWSKHHKIAYGSCQCIVMGSASYVLRHYIDTQHNLAIIGLLAGLWLVCSALQQGILLESRRWQRLGGCLAHLGLGISVIGMSASCWQTEQHLLLSPGQETNYLGGKLALKCLLHEVRPTHFAEIAQLHWHPANASSAHYASSTPVVLQPERRLYPQRALATVKTALHVNWYGDIHIAWVDRRANDQLLLHCHFHPFVVWIWLGALILAIGGGLSLCTRSSTYLFRRYPSM